MGPVSRRIIVTIKHDIPIDKALGMVLWAERQANFTGVAGFDDDHWLMRRDNTKSASYEVWDNSYHLEEA